MAQAGYIPFGIAADRDAARSLLAEAKSSATLLFDEGLVAFNAYGTMAVPSSLVVDAQGRVSYTLAGYPHPITRIFWQPAKVWVEPDGGRMAVTGTTDLKWSNETIKRDILTKAGRPAKFAKRPYPYIIVTALRFGLIDRVTGVVY